MQELRISSKELSCSQPHLREGRNMTVRGLLSLTGLPPVRARQEGKPIFVFTTIAFTFTS